MIDAILIAHWRDEERRESHYQQHGSSTLTRNILFSPIYFKPAIGD